MSRGDFILLLRLGVLILLSCFSIAGIAEDKAITKEALLALQKEIQQDLDLIVDKGGRYAHKQIVESGVINPFAISVSETGDFMVLAPRQDQNKQATISQKVSELRRLLKESVDKGGITAAAVFVSAKVPVKGTSTEKEGIAIELEHQSGISNLRFVPFELTNDRLKLEKPIDKFKPLVFFKDAQKQNNNKKN